MIPLTRRGRIALAASGAAALAACTAGAVGVRGLRDAPGLAVDSWWARLVDEHRSPGVVRASTVLGELGATPRSIVVTAVIGALLLRRHGPRAAIALVAAATIAGALNTALKFFDQRPGPSGATLHDRGSFPSGHTTHAAVIAVVLALTARRPVLRLLAPALVPAMALSRTVLDAHWLTDTAGGAACGAGVAAVAVALLAPGRP